MYNTKLIKAEKSLLILIENLLHTKCVTFFINIHIEYYTIVHMYMSQVGFMRFTPILKKMKRSSLPILFCK